MRAVQLVKADPHPLRHSVKAVQHCTTITRAHRTSQAYVYKVSDRSKIISIITSFGIKQQTRGHTTLCLRRRQENRSLDVVFNFPKDKYHEAVATSRLTEEPKHIN